MMTTAFAEKIGELLSASGKIRDLFSRIDLIMNPAAGIFMQKGALPSRIDEIGNFMKTRLNGRRGINPGDFNFHVTRYPGHAGEITREVSTAPYGESAVHGETEDRRRLIITAGGDGTHLEALSALVDADEAVRLRTCIFRLPMGTGNDSADAVDLREACSVLSGDFSLSMTGAVRFLPKGMQPLYAFNIGSIGLDAYVVELTNTLKRKIPGHVYKLMVNVATVFYEPLYGVKRMKIRVKDDKGGITSLEDRFIMLVIGLSGHRTYGDHLHILPGSENICAVRTANLFRKLEIKKRFYTGEHGGLPEVSFAKGGHIEIDYDGKIPLQLDGEAVWLKPENFPLKVDVLDPVITVLHG